MKKKGLGKGLEALLGDTNVVESEVGNVIVDININEIEPNLEQPRKNFNESKIISLADSIKNHGIVQPIIVKKENSIYKIIAGERRWRAARIAGLKTIPTIIRDYSSRKVMEVALIENIQREDLNPIEEGEAFNRLIFDYELTHEDLSSLLGKSRSSITNSIRLLSLPDKIKKYIIEGSLTSGHGRTLITIEDENKQNQIAEIIIKQELSVRETEKLIKSLNNKVRKRNNTKDIQIIEIEEKLKNIFGTKVNLQTRKNSGKIVIEYFNNEELERILEIMHNYNN